MANQFLNLQEIQLTSEQKYNGNLLKVFSDSVKLLNGATSTREYIKHPGAVVIFAELDDGKIIFEEQFRYPLQRTFLELPAGKLDSNEDPLVAAKRELLEETGFIAEKWTAYGEIHPCIGYSDEKIYIYKAQNLTDTNQQNLDNNEFLNIKFFSQVEIKNLISQNKISDAKTLATLLKISTIDNR